jgi:hypothetical protein
MQESAGGRELKELVQEASRALSRLDADRLDELAVSCRLLNRELSGMNREAMARQAREAAAEMAVFGRVLEVTRANLNVVNRLRELRAGRPEYGERSSPAGGAWTAVEGGRGDN